MGSILNALIIALKRAMNCFNLLLSFCLCLFIGGVLLCYSGFSDAGSLYRSHQHNVETASNFSRPSRVKYYDNESSASSIGSSVSQKIDS